jgi:hypothetical protein
MTRLKIFISSVQIEFAKERQTIFNYLMGDALLGRFFEPFYLNFGNWTLFLKMVLKPLSGARQLVV